MPAYTAAKAAQLALAEVPARDDGRWGVTVNTVAPGWIPVERHESVPDEHRAAYAAQVPLRRQGTPEEIAAAVAFLVSDQASAIPTWWSTAD